MKNIQFVLTKISSKNYRFEASTYFGMMRVGGPIGEAHGNMKKLVGNWWLGQLRAYGTNITHKAIYDFQNKKSCIFYIKIERDRYAYAIANILIDIYKFIGGGGGSYEIILDSPIIISLEYYFSSVFYMYFSW